MADTFARRRGWDVPVDIATMKEGGRGDVGDFVEGRELVPESMIPQGAP